MKVKHSILDKIYSYVVYEYENNDLKVKGKRLFYRDMKYDYAISLAKENDSYEILPIADLNEVILKMESKDKDNYRFLLDAYKEKIAFFEEDIDDIKVALSELIPIYERYSKQKQLLYIKR